VAADNEAARLAEAILTQALDVWASLTDSGHTPGTATKGA